MFTVRFAEPKSSKKRVIGIMQMIVLALAERRSFFGQHANDRVGVPADPDYFADRRFVREQAVLDHFADDDDVARKIDIFIVQISAVTEGVSVGGEKTAICPHDQQARGRFHAVVNGLAFHFITKTF